MSHPDTSFREAHRPQGGIGPSFGVPRAGQLLQWNDLTFVLDSHTSGMLRVKKSILIQPPHDWWQKPWRPVHGFSFAPKLN